jgi:hypothetical protein
MVGPVRAPGVEIPHRFSFSPEKQSLPRHTPQGVDRCRRGLDCTDQFSFLPGFWSLTIHEAGCAEEVQTHLPSHQVENKRWPGAVMAGRQFSFEIACPKCRR